MRRSASTTIRFARVRPLSLALATAVLLAISAHGCSEAPAPAGGEAVAGGPGADRLYAPVEAGRRGMIDWRFETDGPVRGSPSVDSELVYIGSGGGTFYALDRATGAERWRFTAAGPIGSSPLVSGELVYFGDRTNTFYALDRRSGRLRWRTETGSDRPWAWGYEGWDYLTSSPARAGEQVIVGSGDGNIYAFDAVTGDERWRVATGGRVRSSPAVHDGVVYVGSADGLLYAIDAATGEVRWRYATAGVDFVSAEFGFDRQTIQGSPVLADETVLFGSRDGKFYAVATAAGDLRWRYDNGMPWVVSSPVVFQGTAIVGSSDGLYVHALRLADGEEVWRFDTGSRVFASPATSGGVVYVGDHDGRLSALDAVRGDLRWDVRLGGAITSSAVVAYGRVYVGCDDGAVYAIRPEDAPAPRRAVYWDAERESRNTLASHERVRDYFVSLGYAVVDRFQLSELMDSSIEDGTASVVVFAMDDLPPTVAPEPTDTVLARRYLDAGGKIVWLGLPPFLLTRNADGQVTGIDRRRPRAVLDVDHEGYNVDHYGSFPTPEGRRWGLSSWRVSVSGVDTAAVTVALALDENGGATDWLKSYGGPPGTGFVFVWGTYEPLPLERYGEIGRIAEYGIGVSAEK